MADLYTLADFCIIPVGTTQPSVADLIAETQRVLEQTDLRYRMHSFGTNIEGPWSDVMNAIHDCHNAVHQHGSPRITTDIRVDTRIDREYEPGTGNEERVSRVERILSST